MVEILALGGVLFIIEVLVIAGIFSHFHNGLPHRVEEIERKRRAAVIV